MPSKKIISVLIICLGIIISIWLWAGAKNYKPEVGTKEDKTSDVVTTETYQKLNDTTNGEWKNILVKVDPKDEKIAVTSNLVDKKGEMSVTAQISKDVLTQAFIAAKSADKSITATDAKNISSQIISSQSYVKTNGAVYLEKNLHTTTKNDNDTLKKYYVAVNKVFSTRLSQIKTNDEPMAMVQKAIENDDAKALVKMDEYIIANQGFINDMLEITVPSSVTKLHLDILNSASNILVNLQSMRNTLTDPVDGMSGMGQYYNHLQEFVQATKRMIDYFKNKLR
jgi:hypothetical protein